MKERTCPDLTYTCGDQEIAASAAIGSRRIFTTLAAASLPGLLKDREVFKKNRALKDIFMRFRQKNGSCDSASLSGRYQPLTAVFEHIEWSMRDLENKGIILRPILEEIRR